MAGAGPKNTPELSELVQRMQHLKAEHTPLLTQIEGDPGMSADVRQALLAHLNEEEEELIAQIALLSPTAAARATAQRTVPGSSRPAGLTVGSLRQPVVRAWPRMPRSPAVAGASAPVATQASRPALTSVGSLRRR